MLLKQIIGLIIILCNIAGIGFVIYLLITKPKNMVSEKPKSPKKAPGTPKASQSRKPKKIQNSKIIPDEDDLLQDMDLSDLDNLNLDDFD